MLYALSDVHIRGTEDPAYLRVVRFIQKTQSGDILILAGDIFDFLLGNKKFFLKRYERFFEEVQKSTERGVTVHYIEGNHDFYLSSAFKGKGGVEVHPKELSLEIDNKRIFISHGDLADPSDKGYLFLRWLYRSLFCRILIFVLPGEIVSRIGDFFSSTSRSQKKVFLPQDMLPNDLSKLRDIYRSYSQKKFQEGLDFVIMGHCHDLDELRTLHEGRECQYLNIGYPKVHDYYLKWDLKSKFIDRERFSQL